jgi:uncharacterized RDD family membrane protein YckC
MAHWRYRPSQHDSDLPTEPVTLIGLPCTPEVPGIHLPWTWNKGDIWVIIAYAARAFTYFAYSWPASGRTTGMVLTAVRVVRDDGTGASGRRAMVRTLGAWASAAAWWPLATRPARRGSVLRASRTTPPTAIPIPAPARTSRG